MKQLATALLMLALALPVLAGERELRQYVPTDADMVIYLDADALIKHPDIKPLLEHEKLKNLSNPQAATTFRTMPMFESAMAFLDWKSQMSGILLKMKSTSDFVNYVQLKGKDVKSEIREMNGKTVIVLFDPVDPDATEPSVGMIKLADGVMLATDYNQLANIYSMPRGISNQLEGMLSTFDTDGKIAFMAGFLSESTDEGYICTWTELFGESQRGIRIRGKIDLDSADTATQTAMVAPLYSGIIGGILFQPDSVGQKKMSKALRCSADGTLLRFEITADEELIRLLCESIKENFESLMSKLGNSQEELTF
ncbi:MAG: hypothetical protein MJ025_00775 [Victivallaceae bacterium]|nr:hypothetical protein [Victivallaceae bacterium]